MDHNIPEVEYRLWKDVDIWPGYIKPLIKNPILDILQKGKPHIRYYVARDVIGLPFVHPLVLNINNTLHYQKKYKKILRDEISFTISDSAKQRELDFIFLMEKIPGKILLTRCAQLGALRTLFFKLCTLACIVAAPGEGIHVMQCPHHRQVVWN